MFNELRYVMCIDGKGGGSTILGFLLEFILVIVSFEIITTILENFMKKKYNIKDQDFELINKFHKYGNIVIFVLGFGLSIITGNFILFVTGIIIATGFFNAFMFWKYKKENRLWLLELLNILTFIVCFFSFNLYIVILL
ncbi:DUF4181 domain-containing protein [Natranaerobius trueperi]|uniref:DUF4181 domain-containing protein n=1 Tax=Natranaerobius trueperi TaxID=759412 RepID=A0A226C050_9FIRM|nr:DUF4181 domain-containing protein [Natranaerobius trueperi]OWZ84668.1 hypothetical protein CDO51_02590 [Natranaerobius trueperi]